MTAPRAVADGVWVITEEISGARPSAHRDDLLRAAALPEWRAREFLAGRGLLRRLLTAVRPELASGAVVPDAHGKPWLRACPEVGVSVSHSRGRLAAAVAVGARVGVDVQRPGATVTASFARRLLGETGAEALAGLPAARAAEEVAWVWTAQEACVKADGQGLAGRPWTVGVAPGSRFGRWGPYRWIALRGISATPLSCAFGSPDQAMAWAGGEEGPRTAGERTRKG